MTFALKIVHIVLYVEVISVLCIYEFIKFNRAYLFIIKRVEINTMLEVTRNSKLLHEIVSLFVKVLAHS